MEAGQTWDYELSQANAIDQITLPSGCEPVPADIPAMADAQAVEFSPGQLTYTTPSSVAQVIDFYNQKLPALGWTNTGTTKPKDNSSNSTLLYYQKDTQDLTIFMDSSSGALQITVVLSNQAASQAAAPPAIAAPGATAQPAATPHQPAATADFSKSGLPSDVPPYPGATNLVSLGGMGIQFSTGDTPPAVASFYKTHLSASGWSILNEVTSGDHTVQMWQKNGKTLNVVVTAQNGGATVVLALTP